MYIYSIIILLLSYLSMTYRESKRRKKELILLFIIFIAAFKYKVGGDWYHYQNFYEDVIPEIKLSYFFQQNIGEYFGKYPFERAYGFLNFIFYKLGFNYEFFQGIVMCFLLFKIFNFIKKGTENYYFSILILFTTSFFSYMFEPFIRQLIAIFFVLLSIEYIEKNKNIKFLLCILIAVLFHRSAIICLFIYFFKYIKLNNKLIIISLPLFYIGLMLTPKIIGSIPIISVYSVYFDTTKASILHTATMKRTLFVEILKLFILILRINIIFCSYRYTNKYSRIIENMAIIFCIISYFQNILPIIGRVQGYFLIPYVMSYSSLSKFIILKKYRVKMIGKIFSVLFVLLSITILVKNIYLKDEMRFKYEYQNYFFKLFLSKEEKRKEREEYFIELITKNKEKELEKIKKINK